jgi:hypothetical protein
MLIEIRQAQKNRQRQEDHELKASLDYIPRPCLQIYLLAYFNISNDNKVLYKTDIAYVLLN